MTNDRKCFTVICYHMLLTNRMMLQMGHAVLSRKDSLVLPCVHMCMEANNFLDSTFIAWVHIISFLQGIKMSAVGPVRFDLS